MTCMHALSHEAGMLKALQVYGLCMLAPPNSCTHASRWEVPKTNLQLSKVVFFLPSQKIDFFQKLPFVKLESSHDAAALYNVGECRPRQGDLSLCGDGLGDCQPSTWSLRC